MTNLFTGAVHSQLYKQFRPTYPVQLIEAIIDFCRGSQSRFTRCVDLGCGSGQSTLPLAPFYDEVIGLDVSPSQIDEARKEAAEHGNVSFRVGSAEDLSFLEPQSVSLITVAQAFHWMQPEAFYSECRRVLQPNGTVAIYGYGNMAVDIVQGDNTIQEFYRDTLWKQGYWDDRRKHIDNLYEEFCPLPLQHYKRNDSLSIQKLMTVDETIGYISTWSGYQCFQKSNPEETALAEVHKVLTSLYKDGQLVKAKWPIFLLLGHL